MNHTEKLRTAIGKYQSENEKVFELNARLDDAKAKSSLATQDLMKAMKATGKHQVIFKGNEYILHRTPNDQPDSLEVKPSEIEILDPMVQQ